MESGIIKPINHNSVHKICSGQVVLTLATAVKELVENSIDAGATIIEVKLKEYGSEQIEVIDNGKGVKASDFQSITLKHHTSKISDFSDVEFVSTFGFRGEALSSLCALSNVEIITCHQDSKVGSLLVYDHNGALIKTTPIPRQVGTTTVLKNLFFTLPVRHKEFLRNIRREYAKMVQLLTAYCLISKNKRITCTNVTDKGKKSIVLSTNCCNTYKENISCIFGSKQVNSLMEFVQHSPSESVLEEYFVQKSVLEKCKLFQIEGYISSSTHGEGRSSADRQFFYINGRPCDFPKISKLINEIYHSFNKAQYPFIFLNIAVSEGSADVNVTPDKRQIFIQEEKLLLCIIKTSILQMYQIQPSQMKISSSVFFFQKSKTDNSEEQVEHKEQISLLSQNLDETLKRKADSSIRHAEENSPPFKSLKKDVLSSPSGSDQEILNNKFDDIKDSPDSGFVSVEEVPDTTPSNCTPNAVKIISPKKAKINQSQSANVNVALVIPFKEEKAFNVGPRSKTGNLSLKDILQNAYRGKFSPMKQNMSVKTSNVNKLKTSNDNIVNFFSKHSPKKDDGISSNVETSATVITIDRNSSNRDHNNDTNEPEHVSLIEEQPSVDEPQQRRRKYRTIAFDIEGIRKILENKKKNSSESFVFRKFRSKIAPTDNHSAEEELKKEIRKTDFSEMNIIGQFNLGFIITRLNDDLFIIDQHATDEKYNYEVLQKETVLETQKLLNPQNLNLTAVSEAVLLDNVHIFEKSGFKFSINEENSVGNKVQLVSVPVSHNWRFGKEDVDEMIFMLTDNPISMVRPSRINQMFASRACRKSVMIGTALTIPMMKKLIVHMGEIEQPWNCPHGRPTMRHLFNMNILRPVSE